MKLVEQLWIGSILYRVIERDIALRINAAGSARFTVATDSKPSGMVLFRCGYASNNTHDYFRGFIRTAHQVGKTWVLECSELIDGLQQSCPISLQNCLITDVLRDVSATTLVQFADCSAGKRMPRFASHADGWHALRMIGASFKVPDCVFWQQTDGRVWIGSWSDSTYTTDHAIDPRYFTRQTADSGVMPALPAIRPGMMINGRRVGSIRLIQHEMQIKWMS